ncbi:SpoIIE family protein phosphatase [Marivirga sp. S37H4]|uniref:SpoIIE family protein phosphatase n=1 Tax=Marivirga aurantiaca TaxID=2802615 RepID=A0A934WXN4_9BACT|nr:SpoIIE family protein phosphatase [Marivirga aurantiaca]MBK6264812.1 SpoIIE family protein phosphatase [Marivirga aurantiaca]
MNLNLTEKFGVNIGEAWKAEYKRIGSIYARWGAILVIFLFPLSIIPELSIEKPNLQVWYFFRLGPSVLVGIVFLLHQKYKFSHELLFEIIAFCLFTSAAYMVECGDWLNYVISMITVFITSAVLVILRPFYFIINFILIFIIQIAVNMVFCGMTVGDYFLLKGVNILLVVGVACFSIAAFRYYIMKNNFMHRLALQEAHFELQERNQSLLKVQKDLRFKSDQIKEQNEELTVQKEEILTQRDAMQTQKEFIEKQNRDIIGSIRYAKQIQRAMLPSQDSFKSYLPQSFIFFVPRDIVSGDFYWLTQKNGKTIVAAVDCTGHGVPGAFMSLVGENNLNQIVKQKGITDPAEILNDLHIGINETLKQTENDNQDGMDAGIVVIDKKSGIIEFAGAKSPLLVVDSSGMATEIKGDKFSIGGKNRNFKKLEFKKHTLPIEVDSSYYLFSDGFADQFGGARDKKYMTKRFRELLTEISGETLTDQKFLLQRKFEEWKNGYAQTDDVLVLGFRLD